MDSSHDGLRLTVREAHSVTTNPTVVFDSARIHRMKDNVEQIQDAEPLMEIFRLILKHKCKYTENRNGVFIDMSDMSLPLLSEIERYVNYSRENKCIINKTETERDVIKANLDKAGGGA